MKYNVNLEVVLQIETEATLKEVYENLAEQFGCEPDWESIKKAATEEFLAGNVLVQSDEVKLSFTKIDMGIEQVDTVEPKDGI